MKCFYYTIQNGYWAGDYIDDEDVGGIPHLDIYTCPVPYCQCQSDGSNGSCIAAFYSDDPNEQCHPPREGEGTGRTEQLYLAF